MNEPIRVSIVGASGYTGFELVKILLRHPQVKIAKLAVHQNPGMPFSNLYPALKGLCDIVCSPIEASAICAESDVVFFGLPHTTGMAFMPDFLAAGKKIIDLSADYRLNTPEAFKAA
ncbi:MAG: N-acetyl-gamma-glutamyl-phosphate reductase, partial [Candidatus Marinimicrobia bacterium]|nr:N-acetyl-gamma-glutamyl-phosphate reductase [Candidatus Neomarinimicrobiota bacterium]